MTPENQLENIKIIRILLLASATILLSHIPYFYYFPPNYGWWQVYAYLSSHGYDLYADLNLKITPLYIYYYKLLLNLSSQIYISILFGIFRTIVIFIFSFIIINKIIKLNIFLSIFLSLILIYVTSEVPSYLPDDYHTFVKLNLMVYIFGINLLLSNSNKKTISSILIAAGLTLVFYSKQNIGIFLLLSNIFVLMYLFYIKKINFSFIIINLSIFACFFFLLLWVLDLNINTLQSLIVDNTAKGPASGIIFNFLQSNNYIYATIPFFLFVSYLIFHKNDKLKSFIIEIVKKYDINFQNYYTNIFYLLIFVSIFIIFKHTYKSVLFLSFSAIFISLIYILKKNQLGSYLFLIFGSIIANTLTSGLASQDLIFFTVFFFAWLLSRLNFNLENNKLLIYLIIIIICTKFLFIKTDLTYKWFDIMSSKTNMNVYSINNEKLNRIKTDKNGYIIYKTIEKYISEYSISDNDVLFYPHIPIYYILFNKITNKQPVQWFDFSDNKDTEHILEKIKNKSYKLVVILDPNYNDYVGHSIMKRQELIHMDLIEYLNSNKSPYKLDYYKIIYDDRKISNDQRIAGIKFNLDECNIYKSTFEKLSDEELNYVIQKCQGVKKHLEEWVSLKIYILK